MSKGSYPGGIRVIGVQEDAANVVGLRQAEVCPGFALIGTFVNAGACIGRAAGIDFSRAYPDGAGFPVHCDVSNRHDHFLFKQRRERKAVVFRFPEPPGGISDVKMGGVFLPNVNIGHAPAHHGWAHIAKFNSIGDGSVPKRLPLGITLDTGLGKSKFPGQLRLPGVRVG